MKLYRDKMQQIREFNPLCKLYVVPVIPSKSDTTNTNVGYFNNLVVNELVQHFSKLYIVWGTDQFVDNMTGRLSSRFNSASDSSGLHLNKVGMIRLVRMIKDSIFDSKKFGSKVHSSRLYSSALRDGPHPHHR